MADNDDGRRFHFEKYSDLPIWGLIDELITTQDTLANLHDRVGFLQGEKVRDPRAPHVQVELYEKQELIRGYEEQKWVLIKLIEYKREGMMK